MEKIELLGITKNDNVITFDFSYTQGLSKYFTGRKFTIHYPIDIKDVPDSILVIPFLSNLIQLAWITDSVMKVPSLDKDFYDSLPKLKNALAQMFPETNFAGELVVDNVEENVSSAHSEKVAMFFSGGVDSFQTLISHYKEDIDLLTVWGSDINYNNEGGWTVLFESMFSSIKPFDLRLLTIHSSFRDVDNEKALYRDFSNQLKDSWWHGMQHGAGLLGHVAPLAFKLGYKKMYIASTHSTHDVNVRCSSHPTTDNCIKYCGCQVFHDGFEFKRQQKIKNIIEFSNQNPNLPINLHVCWKTQTGSNCCSCEKCARTIYAILIEGGDPEKFGFPTYNIVFSSFSKKRTRIYLDKHPHLYHAWFDIADRAKELKSSNQGTNQWKNTEWLTRIDRKKPKSYRVTKKPLRVFVHRVINKFKQLKNERLFSLRLSKEKRKNNAIFLLGTPTHCNIGDAAIAQAENDFINSINYHAIEITANEWNKYKRIIKKKIGDGTILLHGGGNFGNLWPSEELIRKNIIESFPNNSFVLMPQTFFVTSSFTEESLKEMQNTYNDPKFSLFVREKFSLEKIKSIFPRASSLLVPDIVLFEKNSPDYNILDVKKTTDVLLILRNDKEGLLDYDDYKMLERIFKEERISFKKSDMLYELPTIGREDRKKVIINKLKEFASSKVVVTDRLHGMIFAFLANVPCIVLQNNNYKIKGVYDWLKNSNGVFLADGQTKLKELIMFALSISNLDNKLDDGLFDNLRERILNGEKDADC